MSCASILRRCRGPLARGLVVLVLAATVSCTRVGLGGEGAGRSGASGAPPRVGGTWSGLVSVEGQGWAGRLTVRQEGGALSVVLEADEVGLRAEGEGRITFDGAVFMTLTYDLRCPGSLELEGRRSEDGMVLDGTVIAEDCTGRSEGGFSFRR